MEMKRITAQLEEIAEEICDHYCKYSEQMNRPGISEDEAERIQMERCESCPLNRL